MRTDAFMNSALEGDPCRKWTLFSDKALEEGSDDSPDNCKICRRKLRKEKESKHKNS